MDSSDCWEKHADSEQAFLAGVVEGTEVQGRRHLVIGEGSVVQSGARCEEGSRGTVGQGQAWAASPPELHESCP